MKLSSQLKEADGRRLNVFKTFSQGHDDADCRYFQVLEKPGLLPRSIITSFLPVRMSFGDEGGDRFGV
jgi:hypothetical protein